MLQKIHGLRLDVADRERHWFQDEFFDLFAWTHAAGKLIAFQLCYDRLNRERVLVWSEAAGFVHRRIDDGEALPVQKMAPIMVADGHFEAHSIAAEFDHRTATSDPRWRRFIRNKIDDAATQLPVPKTPS